MLDDPNITVISRSRAMISAGWDDVPHLDEETKRDLLDSTPPHLRDARSKGIPSIGAGAIYPIQEADIRVDPFPIPDHWPRAYAIDPGWRTTAAVWGAWDRDTSRLYIYAEHYRKEAEPTTHAQAIRARGEWMHGVIDPAAMGSTIEGTQVRGMYEALGLNLETADNAVEAGLYDTWMGLEQGRIKVFSTCQNWFAEYRAYHRDEKGKIVKKDDHLMDCTRYLVRSGKDVARVKSVVSGVSMTAFRNSSGMGY